MMLLSVRGWVVKTDSASKYFQGTLTPRPLSMADQLTKAPENNWNEFLMQINDSHWNYKSP